MHVHRYGVEEDKIVGEPEQEAPRGGHQQEAHHPDEDAVVHGGAPAAAAPAPPRPPGARCTTQLPGQERGRLRGVGARRQAVARGPPRGRVLEAAAGGAHHD